MVAGDGELERGLGDCAGMFFGGLQRTPIGNRKHLARERREPDRFQELLNLFKIFNFGRSILFSFQFLSHFKILILNNSWNFFLHDEH